MMITDPKVEYARNYILGKVIKGYIVGDLKKLLEIDVRPGQDGNCNFPIALYTLTTISFLGGAMNGNNDIFAYIKKYFDTNDRNELLPYESYFKDIFRNGLAHYYFPRKAAISRVDKSVFTKTDEGDLVLQADIFANMFLNSLDNLEKLFNEEALCIGIYNRFIENQITTPQRERQPRGDFGSSSNLPLTAGATGVQGPI